MLNDVSVRADKPSDALVSVPRWVSCLLCLQRTCPTRYFCQLTPRASLIKDCLQSLSSGRSGWLTACLCISIALLLNPPSSNSLVPLAPLAVGPATLSPSTLALRLHFPPYPAVALHQNRPLAHTCRHAQSLPSSLNPDPVPQSK